eukprot:9950027-Heterocapsa_arctica.AAC.1
MLNHAGAQKAQAVQAAAEARVERAGQYVANVIGGKEELTSVINVKLLKNEWVFTFSSVAGLGGLRDGMRVASGATTDLE